MVYEESNRIKSLKKFPNEISYTCQVTYIGKAYSGIIKILGYIGF